MSINYHWATKCVRIVQYYSSEAVLLEVKKCLASRLSSPMLPMSRSYSYDVTSRLKLHQEMLTVWQWYQCMYYVLFKEVCTFANSYFCVHQCSYAVTSVWTCVWAIIRAFIKCCQLHVYTKTSICIKYIWMSKLNNIIIILLNPRKRGKQMHINKKL